MVSKTIGTPFYMAPEIHEARHAPCEGKRADFFSLGVLMFILAFGVPPFHSATKQDTYFRFLKQKPGSKDFFKYHPHTRQAFREGKLDEGLMDLLLALLTADPERRVSSTHDLMQFEYLASSNLNAEQSGAKMLNLL